MKLPAGTTTISGHSGQSLKLSPEPGLMQSPEFDGATGTRRPSHGSPLGAVACGCSAYPELTRISTATNTSLVLAIVAYYSEVTASFSKLDASASLMGQAARSPISQ
jgi:hypothetical protein